MWVKMTGGFIGTALVPGPAAGEDLENAEDGDAAIEHGGGGKDEDTANDREPDHVTEGDRDIEQRCAHGPDDQGNEHPERKVEGLEKGSHGKFSAVVLIRMLGASVQDHEEKGEDHTGGEQQN